MLQALPFLVLYDSCRPSSIYRAGTLFYSVNSVNLAQDSLRNNLKVCVIHVTPLIHMWLEPMRHLGWSGFGGLVNA